MDNDVTIVVDAKNRSAAAFGEATKGAKTVGDVAERAGKQVKDMGDKLDVAQERARRLAAAEERAAEKARRMAQDLSLLRHQLQESGDESGVLARKVDRLATDTRFAALATEEYRRAANRAAADAREQARAYDRVADNARQAARAVALLGASTKLSGGGGGGKGGGILSDISDGFLNGGFGGASSAAQGAIGTPVVGPVLLAGAAAAAVPAASFLGGALGGAVGLGGAAAGAGLGLAGAWMGDPDKYGAKWDRIIDGVKKRWMSSSSAFTDELDQGLKTVDQTLQNLPIEKVLALSQNFVTPLATGAGQGLSAVANGFADALERAQPIIDVIGPKIGNLGNSIGDAFRAISMGSEGGAHALGDLIDLLGYGAKAAGIMVLGFEMLYQKIRDVAIVADGTLRSIGTVGPVYEGLKGAIFGIASSTMTLGRTLKDTSGSSSAFGDSLGAAVKDAATLTLQTLALNSALTKTQDTMLAMADANLAVAQGWLDLQTGLKDGTRTLDTTTQAGIDNVRVIQDQIGLLERQREQTIDTSDGSVEAINRANAAYSAQVEQVRQAAYAAGFNKDQVDALIRTLYAVPATVPSNVQVTGLSTSLAQGVSLGNALNNIDGRHYNATVDVSYQGYNPGIALGNLLHHAAGGPTSSGWSAVNDWGGAGVGEVMRLPNGSTVIPAGTGRQMMRDVGTAGGRGAGGVVELRVTGSGELYELLHQAQYDGKLQILSSALV